MKPLMRSGGCVPQKRTTPAWMPKALRAFHSASRLREAAVTGEVETSDARSSSVTSAPFGSSS